MDVFQPVQITENPLPLMANTDKITDNFTFLYFNNVIC